MGSTIYSLCPGCGKTALGRRNRWTRFTGKSKKGHTP